MLQESFNKTPYNNDIWKVLYNINFEYGLQYHCVNAASSKFWTQSCREAYLPTLVFMEGGYSKLTYSLVLRPGWPCWLPWYKVGAILRVDPVLHPGSLQLKQGQ